MLAPPVAAPMAALHDAVACLAGVDVHAITDGSLVQTLAELEEVRSRLDGVFARMLHAAEVRDATVAECGRAPRSFLIEELRLGPRDAARRLVLSRRLLMAPLVQAALNAGDITSEHALLILKVLPQLPDDLRPVVEAELVKLACEHPPFLVARAVDAVLAMCGVERSADERFARRQAERGVDLDETFGGFGSLAGTLSPTALEALRLALDAAARAGGRRDDDRTWRQRRHDGLEEIANFYLANGELADVAGERPRVVVTIPLESLLDELSTKVGILDSGLPIAPATARRLACDAELIPAVLDARGDVLDLGVASRSFSTAIRRAAKIRDGGRCGFPRCTRRIADCHHIVWWSRGGRTSLDNAVWLCAFHHWLVHEGGWTLRRNHDGSYTWKSPPGHETTGDPPRHTSAA